MYIKKYYLLNLQGLPTAFSSMTMFVYSVQVNGCVFSVNVCDAHPLTYLYYALCSRCRGVIDEGLRS